mmetsp:Transcript_19122/g.30414  ORF Transcript_19122/g.30414 Transcript_19122/m.30414 type:complete len:208 (+) Transcript_19122:417-1040(+)
MSLACCCPHRSSNVEFIVTSNIEPTSAAIAIHRSAAWQATSTSMRNLPMTDNETLVMIFHTKARERRITQLTLLRSLSIRTMSATSIAIAVPSFPIAIPISAAASAGASLTPSPTIANLPPKPTLQQQQRRPRGLRSRAVSFNAVMMLILSLGRRLECTAIGASIAAAIVLAGPLLSPVSIVMSTFRSLTSFFIALLVFARSASDTA